MNYYVRALKFIFHNWHWKILSIVAAFTFWMWWTSEESIIQFHQVPLKIQNLSSNYDLSGEFVNSVTLSVKGPSQTLGKMKSSDLNVKLNLSEVKLGENTIPLNSENVTLPFGTNLEKISPSLIVLNIERKEKKSVPVKPDYEGEPLKGFVLSGFEIIPTHVTIEGPASQVEAVESASTEKINLKGRKESYTVSVNVFLKTNEVKIEDNLNKIQVRVVIKEEDITLSFDNVPLALKTQKYRTTINPPTIRVFLIGPPSVLNRIKPEDIGLTLDLEGLEPRSEDYLLEPQIKFLNPQLRNEVKSFSFSQKRINVKIYNSVVN